jgi:hypothetical protein
MVKDRAGAPDAAVVVASLRRGASGACCSWQHGDTALWPQQRVFLRWLPIASPSTVAESGEDADLGVVLVLPWE